MSDQARELASKLTQISLNDTDAWMWGGPIEQAIAAALDQARREEREVFAYLDKFKGVTFQVGEYDIERDQYPIYFRTETTDCGAVADFYSKQTATWFVDLLNQAIRQREGA